MLIADLLVENGVTHVVDNVLGSIDPRTMHASDVSINATAIHAASRILDADIFEGEEVDVSTCSKHALVPALRQRFSALLLSCFEAQRIFSVLTMMFSYLLSSSRRQPMAF